MARRLPWLQQGASSKADGSTTKRVVPGKHADRPAKRVKYDDARENGRNAPASDVKSTTPARPSPGVTTPVRRPDGNIFSSSPPQVEEPVKEEFMREGLEEDDIFMMVEDEFYDVARTFTAHIHQREYERLRREARERNQGKAVNIARPVDGRTVLPEDAKRAKERKALEAKRQTMVGSKATESDGKLGGKKQPTNGAWHGILGKLLRASGESQEPMGLSGPLINSRAAAGFKEGQVTPSKPRIMLRANSKDEMSATASEDDLDASPSVFSRRKPPKIEPVERRRDTTVQRYPSPPAISDRYKVSQAKVETRVIPSGVDRHGNDDAQNRTVAKAQVKLETDDGMDDFFKPRPLINSRRNRGVKVETEDENEQKKKTYEIPLF